MHPSILDTSIIDLLEADPRPSLIVALTPHPPTVVYTNPAFAAYPALLNLITAKGEDCEPLWEWITGGTCGSAQTGSDAPPNGGRPTSASFSYSNTYWTRSVVHEQMVVVGANEQIPPSQPRELLPRRIVPVEHDVETVAAETSVSSLPVPDIEFLSKSTPAGLPINPKERPPSRAEAVQSVGRTISEPTWILPDTTPGMLVPYAGQPLQSEECTLTYQNRATSIPRRHQQRGLGADAAWPHAGLAPEA